MRRRVGQQGGVGGGDQEYRNFTKDLTWMKKESSFLGLTHPRCCTVAKCFTQYYLQRTQLSAVFGILF